MSVAISEVCYPSFGKCICVSNGIIELYATVDLGPRIIRFGFVNGQNFMMNDPGRTLHNDVSGRFGDREKWYIYGGHRLWTSPESLPRSYYPDNKPVAWEKTANGIILSPDAQIWTCCKMEMAIQMDAESNTVTVEHRVTNTGAWPLEFAPWALTVLAPGGKEVVPQPQNDTGLLGNRILALWPYTRMNDSRVYWGDKYITLTQDTGADRPFKFGINSEQGYAAYFLGGQMFLKTYSPNPDGRYPDGGVSFETYTSARFLEMETLGELTVTEPGQTVIHTEKWRLHDNVPMPSNDETEIERVLSPFFSQGDGA